MEKIKNNNYNFFLLKYSISISKFVLYVSVWWGKGVGVGFGFKT